MPDAVPGDLIFVNQNDDNVIDDGDKIMIGDPNPDFIFSFSFNLGYKYDLKWCIGESNSKIISSICR